MKYERKWLRMSVVFYKSFDLVFTWAILSVSSSVTSTFSCSAVTNSCIVAIPWTLQFYGYKVWLVIWIPYSCKHKHELLFSKIQDIQRNGKIVFSSKIVFLSTSTIVFSKKEALADCLLCKWSTGWLSSLKKRSFYHKLSTV